MMKQTYAVRINLSLRSCSLECTRPNIRHCRIVPTAMISSNSAHSSLGISIQNLPKAIVPINVTSTTSDRTVDAPEDKPAPLRSRYTEAISVRQKLDRYTQFRSRVRSASELGQPYEADRCQPALGGGHHLHSPASPVRVSCRDPRCVFAQGGRLGVGPYAGRAFADSGSEQGTGGTKTATSGVVHHSDRGVQYASGDHVGVLPRHGMTRV